MTTFVLSQTFTGFMLARQSSSVTLSSTTDTTIDLQVYLSSASGNPPGPVALAGGFRVTDPTTGNLVNYGATVVQNAPDPAQPLAWNVRLVFGPQSGAPTVLVTAYATFATFAAMP